MEDDLRSNRGESPEIEIQFSSSNDQNVAIEEPDESKLKPEPFPASPMLLSPEALVIQQDLQNQRRASAELSEDIRKMEQLKAERERETQEVKKREKLPSYSFLLHKKCTAIMEEAKELEHMGLVDEALIRLTKLILLQSQMSPAPVSDCPLSVHELAEPFKMRAEIYLELSDFQSSVLNYKKVCSLLPDEPEHFDRLAFIYFFYGQVLFDQGQFPEALECFSRAAEMRPDTVGYHTRSIACLASLQRHGECLALVNRRIEAESDNPDLFVMRARLHQLFGNSTLCYYDVRDALELDPDLIQAKELRETLFEKAIHLKNQAITLMLENKLEEALSKMSQAIDNDPTVAELHVLRGAICRRLGRFTGAVDDFLMALDKTDHNENAPVYKDAMQQLILTYNNFAIECFHKQFFEEAISLLNKAIRAEKSEKGLYINRGDCFFQMKNYHFALADYQQALDLDKDDWDIKSRISLIFNEFAIMDYFERRYLEAEEKFTYAIQHNPKVSQYYISRARVRHLLDFKKGAREDVLCALHLNPNNEELFSLIARLFPGKQIGEIKSSVLFQTTVKKLLNAFQLSAPKRPILRPLSSTSVTTQLASKLSEDILVVLPPSSAPSRSGQRSAATTSRSHRSAGGKKKSLGSQSRQSGRRSNLTLKQEEKTESESLRVESSLGETTEDRESSIKTSKVPAGFFEQGGTDRERETLASSKLTSEQFIEKKKQLNDEVRKMYQTAHMLDSLPKRPEVLVNADHLKNKNKPKTSRWGTATNSKTVIHT